MKYLIHQAVNNDDMNLIQKLIIDNPSSIDEKDMRGLTPLHYAILGKKADIMKLLIENKANIYIRDNQKLSPYNYISDYVISRNYQELKKPFLDALTALYIAKTEMYNKEKGTNEKKNSYHQASIFQAETNNNSETVTDKSLSL